MTETGGPEPQRRSEPTPAELHAAISAFLRDLGIDEAAAVELEVLEFRRALTRETDRGVALYAAAHLEDRLATLLRTFLVQDAAVAEPLFKGTGPFASFSARVDAAYLLGLVPQSVRRELHLVRKIRNRFAHEAKPVNFADEQVASQCHELKRAVLAKDPRGKFIQGVMSLAGIIDATIELLSRGGKARCVQAEEIAPQKRELVEKGVELLFSYLPPPAPPSSGGTGVVS